MSEIDADIVIPARYASTRFPGKPLAMIMGKTLIERVAEVCFETVGRKRVWVATDDKRIHDFCVEKGMQTISTAGHCLTGTDRVAEASLSINSKVIINVQGDEPCIIPEDIKKVYFAKLANMDHVVNGFCEYESKIDVNETNIPKVVVSDTSELIYISRANVPHQHKIPKSEKVILKRQVCIYAFTPTELKKFHGYGKRATIEELEDIEILRFLEIGVKVLMVPLNSSLAVDVPEDIVLVENYLRKKKNC